MQKCLLVLPLTLALTACAGAHSTGHRVSPAFAVRRDAPAMRWVDTHGIEVAVPREWHLGRGMCGTPRENTVLWNEDGVLECLIRQPPGLSVVEFGSILQRPHAWYRRHTTRVTIDGALARRWRAGRVDGGREVQLVFPRRGISVTVLSPHRSLLRRILDSVRVVRTNERGCPTRPAPAYRRGSPPGASQPFIPKGAVRAIGCSYKGRWLDLSNRVGRRAAAALTRALDAAPYGFSHARRGSILSSDCLPSWHDSLIVARFEYASGRQPVTVTAHLDGCSRIGASNGRWGIRLRPAWVEHLISASSYAGDFLPYAE